ncbi:hypothetical protein C2S52_007777 [Perilla frutescens var. hirtella]|uniref:RIN4 pathogenic type III effector avirulence factor Avr cleavage site domain-containing protein n=1 Tax=Perilla frutescens var. hirtella TaxID=608512 RepID=A0AAD4J1N6_PERFH|nr:hypothetical protein C2S52_007777 [Perilla frutescens var. hirtella]KAH6812628.1 hypothetical protein C2S51_021646 [Perilla frutescens var. frutescens]KAH6825442.1 hypothetical protein C2S53_005929 [Perilla frutescens var. hirtella]
MTDNDKKALPKFGSWDVNNPAAAGQYSMIFDRARNEKRANPAPRLASDKPSFSSKDVSLAKPSAGRRWLCCSSLGYAES